MPMFFDNKDLQSMYSNCTDKYSELSEIIQDKSLDPSGKEAAVFDLCNSRSNVKNVTMVNSKKALRHLHEVIAKGLHEKESLYRKGKYKKDLRLGVSNIHRRFLEADNYDVICNIFSTLASCYGSHVQKSGADGNKGVTYNSLLARMSSDFIKAYRYLLQDQLFYDSKCDYGKRKRDLSNHEIVERFLLSGHPDWDKKELMISRTLNKHKGTGIAPPFDRECPESVALYKDADDHHLLCMKVYVSLILETLVDKTSCSIREDISRDPLKGGVRTKVYLDIGPLFMSELSSLTVTPSKLPCLSPTTHLDDRFMGTGWVMKDQCVLSFNKEKSLSTRLSLLGSRTVQEISKTPYQIDSGLLCHYLDDFEQNALEPFVETNIWAHKNEKAFINANMDFDLTDGARIKQINALKESYRSAISKSLLVIEGVILAQIYRHSVMYFRPFLDFRCRLYFMGFGLNPHGPPVLRNLVKMITPSGSVVRLDAHASGFQIAGALLRYDKLLYDTNSLASPSKNTNLYKHMQGLFASEGVLLDYKTVKGICMRFIYSESSRARVLTIIKAYAQNSEVLTYQEAAGKEARLKRVIAREYQPLVDLMDILKSIAKVIQKPLVVTDNEFFSSRQRYVIQKKAVTRISTPLGRRQVTLEVDKLPFETCDKQSARAFVPNLFHSIDAFIMFGVIAEAHRWGFKVTPIHDCFVCCSKRKEDLQTIYRMQLCAVHNNSFVQDILKKYADEDIPFDDDVLERTNLFKDEVSADKIYTNFNPNILVRED